MTASTDRRGEVADDAVEDAEQLGCLPGCLLLWFFVLPFAWLLTWLLRSIIGWRDQPLLDFAVWWVLGLGVYEATLLAWGAWRGRSR